jgi:hypothetical protein
VKGNLVQNPLHHRLQPPRTDVFDRRIEIDRDIGKGVDGVIGEGDRQVFGAISATYCLIRLASVSRQDAAEIILAQRLQLHADRQTALQFRQQVGWLGDVETRRTR